MMPGYKVAFHHQVLAGLLEKVCKGWIRRLMVFEPPRHGKSEQTSIKLPGFYLGWFPQRAVIGASYDLDLARSFSRAVRDAQESESYKRLFPKSSTLATRTDTHWMIEGKEDGRNSFIASGVGGGITGQGANLLIIDDPIKNYEDALSQVKRDTCWNWFTSTARTRLAPNGAIIITLTRWHEDDLPGRLLRLAQEDPTADQWVVLEMPATNDGEFQAKLWSTDDKIKTQLFEPYEALWPEMYNREYLDATRSTLGTMQFSALYGCTPKAAAGNLYKREWFNRWYVNPGDKLPVDCQGLRPGYGFKDCRVLAYDQAWDMQCQSWDFAFKDKVESDKVSGGVWGRLGAEKVLLDRVNERLDYVKSKAALLHFSSKWPEAHAKYIEDKANGPAIISDLKERVSGLIAVEPIGSKEARAAAASPDAEAGNIILPHPSIAPWVYDFIECLCSFPNGVYDDDVDMYSQAMYKMKTSGIGLVGLWKREAAELKASAEARQTGTTRGHGGLNARVGNVKSVSSFNKVMKDKFPNRTSVCPTCGQPVAQGQEGSWKCGPCNITGRDKEASA